MESIPQVAQHVAQQVAQHEASKQAVKLTKPLPFLPTMSGACQLTGRHYIHGITCHAMQKQGREGAKKTQRYLLPVCPSLLYMTLCGVGTDISKSKSN